MGCLEDTLAAILARLDKIEAQVNSPSKTYFTSREAAAYLGISYSTFRKKATRITRCPQTSKYRKEDLDTFAVSLKPKRKR